MTEIELERIIGDRFAATGLPPYLSEREQQCLEMEDGFFVEIVLKDASKLGHAEKVIGDLKSEMVRKGIAIDSVVRALWKVKEVRYLGAPPAESGGIMSAVRFHAVLESGEVEQVVEVDVSMAAEQELKGKVGRVESESLKRLVENFLALRLSTGGTSSWDPIRDRHQDIGPMAILYLLHHSPMTAA